MIPDTDAIAGQLQLLPNEIAAESTAIVNLVAEKNILDKAIDEIETAVKFQIGTDKALTNDTARRGAIKDLLAQNKEYELHNHARELIKNRLDLTVIAHQRKRDMFNALIAIAGMS